MVMRRSRRVFRSIVWIGILHLHVVFAISSKILRWDAAACVVVGIHGGHIRVGDVSLVWLVREALLQIGGLRWVTGRLKIASLPELRLVFGEMEVIHVHVDICTHSDTFKDSTGAEVSAPVSLSQS